MLIVAKGPAPECARLELPVDLPHPDASDTTEATLFRFGLCCTIALNGTDCGRSLSAPRYLLEVDSNPPLRDFHAPRQYYKDGAW